MTSYGVSSFLPAVRGVLDSISENEIDLLVEGIRELRETGGRLFVLGSGGGAAHASHAVADFRKLCDIECYSPSDNVAELTARTNDDGWPAAYADWLVVSRLSAGDALLVLSVGGGSVAANLSPNLVTAVDLARKVGATVFGIVGRSDGHTARHAQVCLVVGGDDPNLVTPVAESVQCVVWHLLATHPRLRVHRPVWEDREPLP